MSITTLVTARFTRRRAIRFRTPTRLFAFRTARLTRRRATRFFTPARRAAFRTARFARRRATRFFTPTRRAAFRTARFAFLAPRLVTIADLHVVTHAARAQ